MTNATGFLLHQRRGRGARKTRPYLTLLRALPHEHLTARGLYPASPGLESNTPPATALAAPVMLVTYWTPHDAAVVRLLRLLHGHAVTRPDGTPPDAQLHHHYTLSPGCSGKLSADTADGGAAAQRRSGHGARSRPAGPRRRGARASTAWTRLPPAHLSQPQEHRIRSGREAAGFEALSCRSRGQTRACPAADPGRDASARLRKQRPMKQRSRAAASDPPPGNPPHRASSEWPLPALRSPVRYAGHTRRYNQAPSLPRLSSPGPHPALHQHPLILFSSPRSSPHPSSSSSCCVVDIYSPAVPAVGAVRRI